MKWFGWKAAGRAEARPVLARGQSYAVLGEWPRSYEAQVRAAYLGNAIAQRAVKLVAEGVGSAPVAASDARLAGLVAARSGGQPLIEALAAYLLLHGNAYGGGLLRWLSGANGGLESAIAVSAGATVTLRAAPVFAVEAGALVELIEGCDKSLATCAGRFANASNFRGEPYLPGMDLLTRYPGA